MWTWIRKYRLWILIAAVVMAGALVFGCGQSGSNVAPSGGTSAPVAVELPGLDIGAMDSIILQ